MAKGSKNFFVDCLKIKLSGGGGRKKGGEGLEAEGETEFMLGPKTRRGIRVNKRESAICRYRRNDPSAF